MPGVHCLFCTSVVGLSMKVGREYGEYVVVAGPTSTRPAPPDSMLESRPVTLRYTVLRSAPVPNSLASRTSPEVDPLLFCGNAEISYSPVSRLPTFRSSGLYVTGI